MRRADDPGIYKILNTVNGKLYIGSAVKLSRRWLQHKWLLRSGKHNNRHLQGAWKKYGEASFEFIVLERVEAARLIEAEQSYIDRFKPYDPEVGYNISPTAGSTIGVACTPEKAAKIGAANRGRKFTAEHKAAISPLGRLHREETRQKIGAKSKQNNTVRFLHSSEVKAKAREGRSNRIWTEEDRQRKANSMRANESHMDHCRRLAESQRKLTEEQVRELVGLRDGGMTWAMLALKYAVADATIRKAYRRATAGQDTASITDLFPICVAEEEIRAMKPEQHGPPPAPLQLSFL